MPATTENADDDDQIKSNQSNVPGEAKRSIVAPERRDASRVRRQRTDLDGLSPVGVCVGVKMNGPLCKINTTVRTARTTTTTRI